MSCWTNPSQPLPLQFLALHLGLCLDRPLCGDIHGLDFHCQTENLLRVCWKLLLAVHCSSVVLDLLPAWLTPCLHVTELLFHMWLICGLHIRFNQLRSDVCLLSSACDDLPCILDTIFIRLILDKSCCGRRGLRQVSLLPLISFCDPPALASQARYCTCRCGLQLGL